MGGTIRMPSPTRLFFRVLRLLLPAVVIALILLGWGAELLISREREPERVDAAIILQGSIAAERARIAGAMDLLRRGVANRALLSVPQQSYWGQPVQPAARSFLEKNYGTDLAGRVDFCETSLEVNSTAQEAQVLSTCMRERHWVSIAIVTSDYHTRRAGILWRRITRHEPNIRLWVEGVADPEFQKPWWRHRQSAKTWAAESLKLVWVTFGGS
jgi:hypothetical protein